MKDKLIIVVKSILFVLIFVLISYVLTYLLIPGNNTKKYGIIKIGEFDILQEKENTIDAVFLGDSVVYSGISPMEIWNEFGYTVYDCAQPAQLTATSYDMLQAAIEGHNLKVAFFEADVLFRDKKNTPKNYYFDQKFKKFFPLSTYHNNWKEKILKFLNTGDDFTELNVYKGYRYIHKIKGVTVQKKLNKTDKIIEIPKTSVDAFKKMIRLSKEKNVKLVLIGDPNLTNFSYERYNAVNKLAKEYGIEYIDLNKDNPLKIDWSKDTKDMGKHLNYWGAKKVSKFIGEYLKKTGLLEDHRNDEKYQSWNEAYRIYKSRLK